ncbi:MAG: regulatory protein RecX [Candidatus Kapaibacterium sp.]|jgi:regulatory protein
MNQIFLEKITKSKSPNKCCLHLSDGSKLTVFIDSLLKFGINRGSQIDDEIIAKLEYENKLKNINAYSYRIAAGFVRSKSQVIDKLRQKGYELPEITATVEKLEKLDLIDDHKFVLNFITMSMRKKWGIAKIKNELRKRGVKPEIFDEIIRKSVSEDNLIDNARQTALKKIRLIESKPKEKQRESLIRYLTNKGYDFDIIKKIINELL